MRTKLTLLWLLVLLCTMPLHAGIDPLDARGFALDKIYDFNGLDAINTFNGNLTLRVPIGGEYTVGDGLKYRVQLTYNSTVWDQEDITPIGMSAPNYVDPLQNLGPDTSRTEVVPSRWFNAGLGWHLTLGELRRGELHSDKFRFSYVSPDGASHFFYEGLHGYESSVPDPAVTYTRDGTYMRMRRVDASNDRIVEAPDGVRHYFRCISGCSTDTPEYRLESMIDARANGVYVCTAQTATALTWTVREAVGANGAVRVDPCSTAIVPVREHVITFEPSVLKILSTARWNRWRVKTVDLAAAHGARAVYTFQYQAGARVLREQEQNIDWQVYSSAKSLIQWNSDYTIDVDLLTGVDFPPGIGQAWQFGYYGNSDSKKDSNGVRYQCSKDASGNCSTAFIADPPDHPWNEITGHLKVVTLPTKGTIEYSYEYWGYPRRTCEPAEAGGLGPHVKARGPTARHIGVTSRKANGGTTYYVGYARDPFGGTTPDPCDGAKDFVGTVIDPLGNATLAYYSIAMQDYAGGWLNEEYGLPFTRNVPADAVPPGTTSNFLLSQQTYQCAAGYVPADPQYNVLKQKAKDILTATSCGAVERSSWVRYEYSQVLCSGDYSGPDCLQSNRRVTAERVVYHDDLKNTVPVYGETLYTDYDGHGNFRTTTLDGSFDDANFPNDGSDATVTFRNYNPGRGVNSVIPDDLWLLSRFYEERITNAAGVLKAQTLFEYAADGFLTGKRTLLVGNIPELPETSRLNAGDLLLKQSRTLNADGSILITERYYGGDKGGVSTTAAFTGSSEQYRIDRLYRYGAEEKASYIDGVGNELLDLGTYTLDRNTGLAVKTLEYSDTNASAPYQAMVTDYTYDVLGRVKAIQPQAPQSQSSIGYDYVPVTDGLRVDIKRPIGSGSLYSAQVEVDPYGRRRAELRLMPDGTWSQQTTSYLANGWKYQESTAKAKGTTQFFTTYSLYDAFGRPGRITLPDGRQTELEYSGNRITQRKEKVNTDTGMADVTSWEHFDRRGNLVKAIQSTKGVQGDLVTRYTYDESNRLTIVTQGSQNRKFFYDKRGFLFSETHPELIADLKYEAFDARGHYGTRKYSGSAENELRYTYDRAERPLTIRHALPNSTRVRPIKTFEYHTNNVDDCGLSGFMKGKLERSTRHNWVPEPSRTGDTMNVNVSDYFSYDGDANVRAKTTGVDKSSGPDPMALRFETLFTYDGLGNLRSTQYPGCVGCTGLSGTPARTVSYTFSQGRVVSVPGFASSISWFPNGLTNRVVHQTSGGVAVADVTSIAAHAMARPESIATDGAHNDLNLDADWTSGTFDYDGPGNIRTTGTDSFTYDGARRLTSACIGGRKQAFLYDEWGNLKKATTYASCSGGSLLGEQVNDVVGTTNRLTASTYDDFGNVIRQGRDAYSWDALNAMTWARTYVFVAGQQPLGKVFLYDAADERVAVADYRVPPADPSTDTSLWRTRWTWTLRGLDNRVLREFERIQDGDAAPLPYQWTNDYVYANGRLLASVNTAGVRHQHPDHLGTPRLLTDANGLAVAAHKYYPFGEEMTVPDGDPSRMRFTGHERDNNNVSPNVQAGDLDYMHARYYSPTIGRFLTVDPAKGTQKEPQSWNRYAYVGSNPLAFVDPNGEEKVLGIHSSGEPGGDYDSGHTWISVYDLDGNGHFTTYGLYAIENWTHDWELGDTSLADRWYGLTPKQEALLNEQLSQSESSLWTPWYTCTSLAVDVVEAVTGEKIDADDNLGFETPREATRSIRELEQREPTTPQQPKRTDPPKEQQ